VLDRLMIPRSRAASGLHAFIGAANCRHVLWLSFADARDWRHQLFVRRNPAFTPRN
jgi:hypothetical protein